MLKSCSKQATNRLPNGTFVFLPSHSFFLQKLCEENFFTTLFIFFFPSQTHFSQHKLVAGKCQQKCPKGYHSQWTHGLLLQRERGTTFQLMPTKTTPLASLPNSLSLSTQPFSPRLWSFNTTPRFVSAFKVFLFFSFFLFFWVELNFVGFVQLDDSLFVEIEIGQSVVVDDPDGAFTVTAFDANHGCG